MQATSDLVKDPPPRRPGRFHFNVRLLLFVLAVSAPFLWVIGTAISQSISGGIVDRGSYKEVDLKALGNFALTTTNLKPEDIPAKYRALDGQRIALRGYMYGAEGAGDGSRRFQLVYNVSICCGGGSPVVQERVFVRNQKEVPIFSTTALVDVIGTLHVKIEQSGGQTVSVYTMDDIQSAKPVGD